jgi:hypothetical protein
MANAAATAALQVLKPDAPKSNSSKKQQALLVLQSSVSQLSKPERVSLRDDIEASLISVASEPALTPPLRAAYLGCLAACASADDRIVFRVADGLLALLQQSPAQLAPIAAFAQLMSCVSHSLTGKCTDVFAAMLRTVKDSASSPRCRAAAFSCARSLIVRFSPALSKSIPDIIKVRAPCLLLHPLFAPPLLLSTPSGCVQDSERQVRLHRREDRCRGLPCSCARLVQGCLRSAHRAQGCGSCSAIQEWLVGPV